MNVQTALTMLEQLRRQFGAVSVTACFETGHGDVEVTAGPAGPRIAVAGQEVPLVQRGPASDPPT